MKRETSIITGKDFIDDTERKIINEELPVLVRYLSDLENLLVKSNERVQTELQDQEALIEETKRITTRVITRIHQLMNLPYVKKLLEEHSEQKEDD